MDKSEVRKILKSRYLEFKGYKNREIKTMRAKKHVIGTLFSLAPVVIMTLFVFGGLLISLFLTQFKGTLDAELKEIEYVGIGTIIETIPKDPLLMAAIKNTLLYTVVVTCVSIFVSLVIAFIINTGNIKGRKILLTLYFLPQVTSAVASALIFSTLFTQKAGSTFGFNLAETPENIIWIIIMSGLWTHIAGAIVIFNTAFSGIGKTEYEAAELDGANNFIKFWNITVPALAPIIAYQLITTIMATMGVFDQAYLFISSGAALPKDAITWGSLGFLRILGTVNGVTANVGLGTVELLMLGGVIITLTLIANQLQPISGEKKVR